MREIVLNRSVVYICPQRPSTPPTNQHFRHKVFSVWYLMPGDLTLRRLLDVISWILDASSCVSCHGVDDDGGGEIANHAPYTQILLCNAIINLLFVTRILTLPLFCFSLVFTPYTLYLLLSLSVSLSQSPPPSLSQSLSHFLSLRVG